MVAPDPHGRLQQRQPARLWARLAQLPGRQGLADQVVERTIPRTRLAQDHRDQYDADRATREIGLTCDSRGEIWASES